MTASGPARVAGAARSHTKEKDRRGNLPDPPLHAPAWDRAFYALKELPQWQVPFAFGFWKTKPCSVRPCL
jgi:hypothetical protein